MDKNSEGKAQFHASALGMKCMEAVRRRFIEGEKIPPGIALIVGTGTHHSIDVNLTAKMTTGSLLPLDAVSDAARDGVNIAWQADGVTLQDDELSKGIDVVRGEAVDKAVRLARAHALLKAPELRPTFVERSWALDIPKIVIDDEEEKIGFDLVGRIDIQEGIGSIRDSKTSTKTPASDVAQRSIQLKAYSFAVKVLDGHPPLKAHLDYIIDNSMPKIQTYTHEVGQEDFDALFRRIAILNKAIRLGVFVPVEPDHWCCSERWCGYYRTCKYVARPTQFAV